MTKSSILLLLVACSGDTESGPLDPELSSIEKAYAGVGGRDAFDDVRTFQITANGERLMTLEGYVPEDGAHPISTFTSVTTTRLESSRTDYERTIPLFGATKQYSVIIDGEHGGIDGVESVFGTPGGPVPSDRWAATRRQQRLLNPVLVLQDIEDGVVEARENGLVVRDGQLRHRIDVEDVSGPIALFVDRHTGEIVEAESLENDYVAGDTPVQVHYHGWRTWDGGALRLPSDVIITAGGEPVHAEQRDKILLDVPVTDASFALPPGNYAHDEAAAARGLRNGQFHESFAGLGVPLDGLQTHVEAQQLGTGVWHLRGGSHNSLVVEQAAGVVVVEAPLYEARAQAIYAWIAQNIPNKTVTHVVVTHHHRDHVGALRTFVARGARVVVGAAARPYFARAFRAARTVEPDELSASPRSALFDVVAPGATFVIADAARPVHVVPIESTHAADMVVAHVPSTKTVFVSDIYSPGLPPNPAGVAELKAGIAGLDVTQIAGGHGIVGPVPQ